VATSSRWPFIEIKARTSRNSINAASACAEASRFRNRTLLGSRDEILLVKSAGMRITRAAVSRLVGSSSHMFCELSSSRNIRPRKFVSSFSMYTGGLRL
jgi:hypothetical protein